MNWGCELTLLVSQSQNTTFLKAQYVISATMGLSVKSKQKTHVAWDYGSSRNTVELHPQDALIQTICSCCRNQVSNGQTEKWLQVER